MRFRGCPQLRNEDRVWLLVVDPDLVEQAAGRVKTSAAASQNLNEEISLAGDRSKGAHTGERHDLIVRTSRTRQGAIERCSRTSDSAARRRARERSWHMSLTIGVAAGSPRGWDRRVPVCASSRGLRW